MPNDVDVREMTDKAIVDQVDAGYYACPSDREACDEILRRLSTLREEVLKLQKELCERSSAEESKVMRELCEAYCQRRPMQAAEDAYRAMKGGVDA